MITTMWQLDVRVYQHYNRRLHQLHSYHGTADELPRDEQRIEDTRRAMDRHFVEMCVYQLDRAHKAVLETRAKNP